MWKSSPHTSWSGFGEKNPKPWVGKVMAWGQAWTLPAGAGDRLPRGDGAAAVQPGRARPARHGGHVPGMCPWTWDMFWGGFVQQDVFGDRFVQWDMFWSGFKQQDMFWGGFRQQDIFWGGFVQQGIQGDVFWGRFVQGDVVWGRFTPTFSIFRQVSPNWMCLWTSLCNRPYFVVDLCDGLYFRFT